MIALLFILAFPAWAACPDTGNGYSYCFELAVPADNITGSGTFTDVMWFQFDENWLETSANGGLVESSSGSTPYDIRIQDNSTNLLPYYVARWDGSDTVGTLMLAVRTFWDGTNGTSIYLYVGKSGLGSSDQSQANTFQDYVAYYGLDQAISTDADAFIDWAAGASHLTLNTVTGPTSSAAKLDNGVDFNGSSNSMVDTTPAAAVNVTGDLTVCAWVRPDGTGDQKILSTITNTTSDGGYVMGLYDTVNNLEGEVWPNPAGTGVGLRTGATGTPATLSTGTWYHVCLEYTDSGDTIRSIVNGAQDRTKATTVVLGVPSVKKIGLAHRVASDTFFFNGIIDAAFVRAAYLSTDVVDTIKINQSAPTKTNWFTLGAQDPPGGGPAATPRFSVQGVIGDE